MPSETTEHGEIYESGDGVPTSIIDAETELVEADGGVSRGSRSLRGSSIAFTIAGQFLVTAMIAAGGDPITGVMAAGAVVICSVMLIAAEAVSQQR